eukprot:jgi/Psemu1/179774/e_gw1.11.14.1
MSGYGANTANAVEGLFSLWAGYRCYDYASHRSEDSLQAIATLPLCKGRSRASEALCPDWIATTHGKIPPAFWDTLDDHQLREEHTWEAIRAFSINCERRVAVEQTLRKQLSIPDHEPVVLPERLDAAGTKHPTLPT